MSLLEDLVELLEEQQDFDLDKVLNLILARLRRATAAEAGTVFVARPVADRTFNHLEAVATQNDVVDVPSERFHVPIDLSSIGGYVASTGEIVEIDDLYNIPAEVSYNFNESFDQKHGYNSLSMLAFPLKNVQGQVIGVVQLINHIGGTDENGNTTYTPFPLSEVDRVKGLMTMLGALVERYDLVTEIQSLRRQVAQQNA